MDNPLLHSIRCILPRKIDSLPVILKYQVLKFLPANSSKEIENSLSIIKQKVKNIEMKYRIIALWVNQQQIQLTQLPLVKFEFFILAKYLTYMDLRELSWNSTDLNKLLSKASSSLSWLNCCNTAITKLPELSNLKWLNINLTSIKSIPKKTCQNLRELYCFSANSLEAIEACPMLEYLDISDNGFIKILPELSNLKYLIYNNCTSLCFVPYYPKLIRSEYKNCPKLLENVNTKVFEKKHKTRKP